jgi:hypothetical protein
VPGVRWNSGVDGNEPELDWRINGARHPKILQEKTNQPEKTK